MRNREELIERLNALADRLNILSPVSVIIVREAALALSEARKETANVWLEAAKVCDEMAGEHEEPLWNAACLCCEQACRSRSSGNTQPPGEERS